MTQTLFLVEILCQCKGEQYCQRCGGRGKFRSTITNHQLAKMGENPTVLGAKIAVVRKRRKKAAR